MAASASTNTSLGENPVGGTYADTGCTSSKLGGSVERVVAARAKTATESGTESVDPRTNGGGASDAATGAEVGAEETGAVAAG